MNEWLKRGDAILKENNIIDIHNENSFKTSLDVPSASIISRFIFATRQRTDTYASTKDTRLIKNMETTQQRIGVISVVSPTR